jgi:4-hydroxy-2-oxoheptanedioate aldolase
MKGSKIKERLHGGQCVFGTHICSLMNPVAAAMAAEMDLDFAFFCTEHMPLDRTEVSLMCQYYGARGISPIVRVPSPDPTAVSMALDGGAEGIVVPYVETVEQARQMVGAVKYRPLKGKLLSDAMSGRSELSAKMRRFLDEFNHGKYLILGVESVPAMENLEHLIDIDGVDGVFLGPHDITVSMGIPTEYNNPRFVDAIEDVVRRCRRRNVGVGLHTQYLKLPPEVLRRLLDAGMNWLINGADITAMRDAMNDQIGRLRAMCGDVNGRAIEGVQEHATVKACIA